MSNLSDTQLVLLSAAAQREDHVIAIGARLKGSVAKSVGQKLMALGLAEERLVDEQTLAWRTDDENRAIALVITQQGLMGIGLGDHEPSKVEATNLQPDAAAQASIAPRIGSKQAAVIAMLERSEGASIDELMSANSWLPHTTRAVLTGLRKKGYVIVKEKLSGVTRYRINPALDELEAVAGLVHDAVSADEAAA